MVRLFLLLNVLLFCLISSGCVTAMATQYAVPKERATECEENCKSLGMHLSAVVIIMNHAGCVCEPAGPDSAGLSPSAAAAAGGAAIQVVAEQQEKQRQQHQLNQRRQ